MVRFAAAATAGAKRRSRCGLLAVVSVVSAVRLCLYIKYSVRSSSFSPYDSSLLLLRGEAGTETAATTATINDDYSTATAYATDSTDPRDHPWYSVIVKPGDGDLLLEQEDNHDGVDEGESFAACLLICDDNNVSLMHMLYCNSRWYSVGFSWLRALRLLSSVLFPVSHHAFPSNAFLSPYCTYLPRSVSAYPVRVSVV